jgi:hypothetical protein
MPLTRLTLPQFDDLAGKLQHAWLRLNAATDTYDALRALAELHVAWQEIQAVDAALQPADGHPSHEASSIAGIIARYHVSLLRQQSDPALAIQRLLDRVAELDLPAADLPAASHRESTYDTQLIHAALPVLWRLIRSLRYEIRHRRPCAYFHRVLRHSARVLLVLGVVWLIVRVFWFAGPWGLLITYYRGENFERACGWEVAGQLCRDYGTSRPLPWMPREHWSARWHGYLVVPQTAGYDFFCQSDDGLRVWLDGELLVDSWRCQGWGQSGCHATRKLMAGRHAVRLDFFNHTEDAALRIRWTGGPIPPDTIIGWPYLRKY